MLLPKFVKDVIAVVKPVAGSIAKGTKKVLCKLNGVIKPRKIYEKAVSIQKEIVATVGKDKDSNVKQWFENLKISRKLISGFLFVSLLGVVIGLVGVIYLLRMSNAMQISYEHCTMGIVKSADSQSTLHKIDSIIRDLYIYYDDSDLRTEYYNGIGTELEYLDWQLEDYKTTISGDEGQANYDAVTSAYEKYKADVGILLEGVDRGKSRTEIYSIYKGIQVSAQSVLDSFEIMKTFNDKTASQDIEKNQKTANIAIIVMLIVVAVSFAIALFLSLYISGIISTPVKTLAKAAEQLAVGDIELDSVFDGKGRRLKYRKDEIGVLANAFGRMIESTMEQAQITKQIADGDLSISVTVRSEADVLGNALKKLVDEFHKLASSIVSSADQVNSGAKLIAESSTYLSQGASEQASAVEELTASIKEITVQTTKNAQNAQSTDELAKSIKSDAEGGNAQMANMLNAMDEINTSSESIGKIIKAIEDIAFQTNILALNAAVEAARAGQYGRGFAVVADEVRNLAAQSSRAAQETTDLIENSNKKVAAGTKIANATAESLKGIVSGITKVSDLVNAIAMASNEQAAGLEQINQGVLQVSKVVESNAAAAEECAAASEELSSQAEGLKEGVGVFKLTKDEALPEEKTFLHPELIKEPAAAVRAPAKEKVKIDLSGDSFGKY